MKTVGIFSKDYWMYLLKDTQFLLKVYWFQLIFSILMAVGFLFFMPNIIFGIVFSLCYFVGTNVLLLSYESGIEEGFAKNSYLANLFIGTTTDKLIGKSITTLLIYMGIKIFVVMFKYMLSPVLLVISLLSYKKYLNKTLAKNELEGNY